MLLNFADGLIQLFSEDDLYNPLVSAVDPKPIKPHYISFKNYMSEDIKFYYGFWPKETPSENLEVVTMHPLVIEPVDYDKEINTDIVNWNLWSWDWQSALTPEVWTSNWNTRNLEMKVLSLNSKVIETWQPLYVNPVEILPKYKPQGYVLRYPLFIQGSRDAFIALSTSQNPTPDDDAYEILLGNNGNTFHQITRKINGKLLAKTRESRVLSSFTPTKFVIEITSGKFPHPTAVSTD